MKTVCGMFSATAAAVNICLGFIPDEVWIQNIEDAGSVFGEIRWFRNLRLLESARGIVHATGTTYRAIDMRTVSDGGISVYRGGELLTSSNQTAVTYAGAVYLGFDKADYKADKTYGVVSEITDWTLGSSANRTGNFNANLIRCDTPGGGAGAGRIGEGSRIVIRESYTGITKETFIHAGGNTSAAAGSAANAVTLDEAVASGKVLYIGPMVDFAPLALGTITPAGITLAAVTATNDVDDERCLIKAVQYD